MKEGDELFLVDNYPSPVSFTVYVSRISAKGTFQVSELKRGKPYTNAWFSIETKKQQNAFPQHLRIYNNIKKYHEEERSKWESIEIKKLIVEKSHLANFEKITKKDLEKAKKSLNIKDD
jgi:hypothetical protein